MTARPLRFATYLAPSVRPLYEAAARHVGRVLGCPTSLVDGRSYGALGTDRVDVAFVCGLPYVRRADRLHPLAAPVPVGDRYGGRPVYFSDVIVRRDHPARSFSDLRGAVWSYNECESHSGYGVLLYRLAELGESRSFFGELVEAGFHAESIRLVRSGEVDAAAVDSHVLEVALQEDPELAEQIRVVEALGPSTIQPVVAARHVPPEVRRAVAAALCGLHRVEPALLAGMRVRRFVPIGDDAYDGIRNMSAAVEAAGLLGSG